MKKKSSQTNKRPNPKKKASSKKSSNGKLRSKSESESGDIATLILRDHKPIKELILVLKDSEVTFSKKQPAFDEFERVLTSHAKAEEESLYVLMKHEDHLRVEGLEGDTEHALADQLMKDIYESTGDEDLWMAKVKVLAELVDHHVKEEEKEVLKDVRKDFSPEQRQEIGGMYSKLLSKYRDENGGPKKYFEKENMRAEYV